MHEPDTYSSIIMQDKGLAVGTNQSWRRNAAVPCAYEAGLAAGVDGAAGAGVDGVVEPDDDSDDEELDDVDDDEPEPLESVL